MYTKLYTQDQKIPAPVALFAVFLVLMIPFIIKLQKHNRAQDEVRVENIVATNTTNSSTSIYWKTEEKVNGTIYYSDDSKKTGTKIIDDRDTDQARTPRLHHLATLRNLKPDTKYYVRVDEGKLPLMEFTTLKKAQLSTNKPPLYGKVTDEKGQPVEGVIILVKIKNANPLSTITKNDGNFLVSICCLTHEIEKEKLTPNNNDTVEITANNNTDETKIVADISMISPLQNSIVLGKDENLIAQKQKELAEANIRESNQNILGQNVPPIFEKIDIFYPLTNMVIPGRKPLIKGSALANEQVTLVFSKPNKTVVLNADSKGRWKYIPEFYLDPGVQTLIMQTIDERKRAITRKRSYSIAKSGESVVLGEATPEGTIIPTTPPIGGPTELPTEAPTLEPTIFDSPSPTPPVSGVSFTTFSLMSIALIAVGAGLILLF